MNYLKHFTLVFLLFFISKTSQAQDLKWQVLNKDSKKTPSNIVESNQSLAPATETDSVKPTTNVSTRTNCPFSLTRFLTDRYGKYDPIKAVIDGDVERVKSLAARGADFNVQDGFIASSISSSPIRKPYLTPLMYAVYMDNFEMAELLINLGVNVNFQNKNNITAFMVASRRDLKLVRILLNPKFGVAIHLRDNSGKTAFLHAVEVDRLDIASFLLVNYLRVAAENHDDLMRETIIKDTSEALRLATRLNYIDTVKFLVKNVHDIDISARNEAGWTAFMIARFHHHTEITDFLSQTGIEFSQRDHQTIDNAEIERSFHRYSNDKTGMM